MEVDALWPIQVEQLGNFLTTRTLFSKAVYNGGIEGVLWWFQIGFLLSNSVSSASDCLVYSWWTAAGKSSTPQPLGKWIKTVGYTIVPPMEMLNGGHRSRFTVLWDCLGPPAYRTVVTFCTLNDRGGWILSALIHDQHHTGFQILKLSNSNIRVNDTRLMMTCSTNNLRDVTTSR